MGIVKPSRTPPTDGLADVFRAGMAALAGQLPIVVHHVTDMEDAVARLTEAGAQAVKGPFRVGNKGIACQLRDPDGNVVSLWQPLGVGE